MEASASGGGRLSSSLFFPAPGRCLTHATERAIELRMWRERAWIVEQLIHSRVSGAEGPAGCDFGGPVDGFKSDAPSAFLPSVTAVQIGSEPNQNERGRTAVTLDPHNPFPKGRWTA